MSSQRLEPNIPLSVTSPVIPSFSVSVPNNAATGQIISTSFSSPLFSTTTSFQPRIPSLPKKGRSNDPLNIPEILELVLEHVLALFQTSSHLQNPFALSSSPSSLATTHDIQFQIRAQKPISTRLAFLRVCRLWYQVGEPLLWRNIKWADHQHPLLHLRIWNHFSQVRSLEFEYGKETTDTERPLIAHDTSSSTTAAVSTSTMNWTNNLRNLLGGDPSSTATVSASQQNATTTSGFNIYSQGQTTRPEDSAVSLAGRPRITLEEALHDLAKTLSRPSRLPYYRPRPLPIKGMQQMHNKQAGDQQHYPTTPIPSPTLSVPLLHRSQLTSLTLTGRFRLEVFMQAILPFVPELTYLDICLRCYEWRDEIRLDKVLRSCPKLQYLSIERHMIGRIHFDEESDDGSGVPPPQGGFDNNQEDDDTEDDVEQRSEVENQDRFYNGTPWHLNFVRSSRAEENDDSNHRPFQGSSISTLKLPNNGMDNKRTLRPNFHRKRQGPLVLRVLKLKKVRVLEQEFIRLLGLCPLLEEMDVFSTVYWSWTRKFLETVSRSCPKIKHLHLTTNYDINGIDTGDSPPAGGPMQAGIIIFHETPSEQPQPNTVASAGGGTGGDNGQANGGVPPSILATLNPAQEQLPPPYDPVVELIKLYPGLISYDARYVRFQDRALVTIQQYCRQLESLDLSCCREISSKAIDRFLRHAPTLKHFSGSRIVLRIEDLIESVEEHDRIVAANAYIRANNGNHRPSNMDPTSSTLPSSPLSDPNMDINSGIRDPGPRWWACERLETFVIGLKNPKPPGTERDFDLQAERTADFQYYYRDYQGSGSTSGGFRDNTPQQQQQQFYKQYDHTQYCTFILFQHLGRLRRLKRLELHGGRFDLGINLNSDSSYSTPQPNSSSQKPSSSDLLIPDDDQPASSTTTEKYKDNQVGSMARRGLGRVRSFLTLGGSGGKSKQKPEGDALDPKNKGKGKASSKDKDKGKEKGRIHDLIGTSDPSYTEYTHGRDLSGGSYFPDESDQPLVGTGTDTDYLDSSNQGSTNPDHSHNLLNYKIVPSQLSGLQPLAGLSNLESFSMVWSNFPMLREHEIVWICQNWTSLEWISLGLVPQCEWDQIRNWVRSRRPDVVVVFEK